MGKGKAMSRAEHRAKLPRVLVVDANPGYRSVISHVVELAGGQFESVAELEQARRLLDVAPRFDVVIIGVSAGSPVTPEEVRALRTAAEAPLIMLAESYDNAREVLEVFEAGADQVLPKPFVPDALIGAIKAEIRGSGPASVVPVATRIEVAGLAFDARKRTVTGGEGSASLTRREWQLLTFLLASPNHFFSAAEVAREAWGCRSPKRSAKPARGSC